ncbi:hypothetical protein Tco_0115921 [Tanacetum coccineum]
MPPQVINKPYTKPPKEKELLAFIKILGCDEDLKQKMLDVPHFVAILLYQYWGGYSESPQQMTNSNGKPNTGCQDRRRARYPLSKLINTVEGEFKFGIEIPDTMINDAIKESARYKYYKIKKDQSEKGNAKEKLEDQNVSLMRSGRGKGYMCLETMAVELAKSVSIKEQRLQQRKIMTRLKIEKQVEKDVDKGYAAKRGLKLKGVATKDPAVQSLLALRKGSKESKLGHTLTRMMTKDHTKDSDIDISDDDSNRKDDDDDAAGFGKLIQAKAKKLMEKAKHNKLCSNFKKAVELKFKEYDQKLEDISSTNVPKAIEESIQAKVLTKMKKQLPKHVPQAGAKFVKPCLNNSVLEVMKNNQINPFSTTSPTTTDDIS